MKCIEGKELEATTKFSNTRKYKNLNKVCWGSGLISRYVERLGDRENGKSLDSIGGFSATLKPIQPIFKFCLPKRWEIKPSSY